MKLFKKLLKAVLCLLLAVILAVGAVRLAAVLYTRDAKINSVELNEAVRAGMRADAIIVLGAGVYEDGSLSPILQARLDSALEVWRSGISGTILVSGDHRTGEYDEVDHMIEYLTANGVPESAIQKDYNGYSTYESMYRAYYLYGIRTAVVVTQNYHLPRALFIGKAYGMTVYGCAAENTGEWTDKALRMVREWIATVKDGYNSIAKTPVDLSVGE